jgi:hypothetical protein
MKTPLAPLHGRVFAERIWHSVKDEEVYIKGLCQWSRWAQSALACGAAVTTSAGRANEWGAYTLNNVTAKKGDDSFGQSRSAAATTKSGIAC